MKIWIPIVFLWALHAAGTAAAQCGAPGVSVSVSPSFAAPGQTITVMLTNNSAQAIVLPSSCTFQSVHAGAACAGTPVFAPFCLTVLTPIAPGASRSMTWDQRYDLGQQVAVGVYSFEVRYFDAAGAVTGCCPTVTISSSAPITYCTAKTNSCGSLPAISATGIPSASSASGFTVEAAQAKGGKCGLLIYSDAGPAMPAPPFQGGFLCMAAPVRRTIAVCDTGGTPGACDGSLSIDMNAFAAGALGGNPLPSLSQPGTQVDCQFWGRDTPGNSLLTDALRYVVTP
jgi:hypothetical protein